MKRIITGLALVGIVAGTLFLMNITPLFFALLTALIAAVGIYEMTRAQKDILPLPYKVLNVFLAVLLLPAFLAAKGISGVFILITILFLAALVFLTFDKNISLQALQGFILVLFYPTILISLIFEMVYSENALFLLLMTFGIAPLSDTFAYAVGSTLKGKKLCPRVSPKKTISGAIGGLIGGILAGLIIYFIFINAFPDKAIPGLWIMLIAGLIGGVFTEAGDLAESALKRKLNLKDFGNILPGHGGILDRVDSILFNALFVYVFFSYVNCIF